MNPFKLQPIIKLLIKSSLAFALLRPIINKDHFLMVLIFSIAISFCTVFQQNNQINIDHRFFSYISQLLVYLIGGTHIILSQINRFKKLEQTKSLQNKKTFSMNLILLFQVVLFTAIGAIGFIYNKGIQYILSQDNVFICIAVIIVSMAILFYVYYSLNQYSIQEDIRRKLFHLGPVLTIPIIHYLNAELLALILSAGFYIFFCLELIRYFVAQNDKLSSKSSQIDNPYLMDLFRWMKSFNKRQNNFWFTHLFLILSLYTSYSFKYSIFSEHHLSPHSILVLISADGMAAVIGKKFGRLKVYGKKTVEGFFGYFVTFCIGMVLLELFWEISDLGANKTLIIGAICSIVQLISGDSDNIATLLAFLASLCIFDLMIL